MTSGCCIPEKIIMDHSHNLFETLLDTFPTLPPVKNTFFVTPTTPSEAMYEVTCLLSFVSDQRATDFTSWSTIGQLLYTVSRASKNGILAWIAFTQRSTTFTKEDCIKAWSDMTYSESDSIRILFFYATMDDNDAFQQYKTTTSKNKLLQLLRYNRYELVEADCADALYLLYKDEFFYHDGWYYYFTNGKWLPMKECLELKGRIRVLIGFIMDEIKKMNDQLFSIKNERRSVEDEDQVENKELLETIRNKETHLSENIMILEHTRKQISKTAFKNNIMMECKILFLDNTVLQQRKVHLVNHVNQLCTPILDKKEILDKNTASIELSFVKYIVMEDTEYTDTIILLTSDELVKKCNEFLTKYNIQCKTNPISIVRKINKLHITGITTGIRCTKKDIVTNKMIDINKTKFDKSEIKNYLIW